MRIPNIRMSAPKQEVILFTGGVNEEVNSIQLKSGELFSCTNYQEVGGPYSGYSSPLGYEAFDGQTAPSSVAINTYTDTGIDSKTALLIESGTGTPPADLSPYSNPFTIYDGTADTEVSPTTTTRFKLNDSSFYFGTAGSKFYSDAAIPFDLTGDLCIEAWVYQGTRTGTCTIFSSNLVSLTLTDGYFTLSWQTTGGTVTATSSTYIYPGTIWQHVAATLTSTGTVAIYIDGAEKVLTATGTPVDPANPLGTTGWYVGADTGSMHIDEIRLSTGTVRFPAIFTPPTAPYSVNNYYQEYVVDTAREAARTAIAEVPGTGDVLGVVYYNNVVYAFRDSTTEAKMYKSSAAGWVEVVQPVGYELAKGGSFKFSNYRFDGYNSNQAVLVITDGVSLPRLFDGTTVTPLTSTELPDNQVTTPRYASISGAYNNRLYLGYQAGSIVFSNIGNPESFSAIIGGSGELFLGDELTNIIEAPGNVLVLTCRNYIKILKDVQMTTSYDWSVQLETFTSKGGAIAGTAQALLGDVFYADDEGVTSMAATNAYGDFATATISNKVQRSFLLYKDLITASLIDRSNNQYRLYMSNGGALYFTFEKNVVKGATQIEYPNAVLKLATGENTSGELRRFFASDTGYVYEMDVGTSFNGTEIATTLATAYFNYGSARNWKHFKRLVLELDAEAGLVLNHRVTFDYSEQQYPKTITQAITSKGVSGIWGTSIWGAFSWGESQIQRLVVYLRGSGANMSISVRTSSKYKAQHTLNNGIVDYSIGSRQL